MEMDPRKAKTQLTPLYNDTLMEIFQFSASTLDANREGRVTRVQRDRLQENLRGDADATWLFMMVMMGVTLLLAVVFTFNGMDMAPLLVGAGIMLLPFVALAYRRQSRMREEIDTPKVESIEGTMQLQITGGGYHVQVGGRLLRVERDQYEALARYDLPFVRVYYAEKTDVLLSLEIYDALEDKLKNDEKVKNESLLLDDDEVQDGSIFDHYDIPDDSVRLGRRDL